MPEDYEGTSMNIKSVTKTLFVQPVVGALILASVVYGGLIAWIAYRPEIKAALLTIQNLIFG